MKDLDRNQLLCLFVCLLNLVYNIFICKVVMDIWENTKDINYEEVSCGYYGENCE